MKKLLLGMALLSSISFATADIRECVYLEGPQQEIESFFFVNKTAFLNGLEMPCGAIPVSFSTFRDLPEVGQLPIGFTCDSTGGGIGSQASSSEPVVQVYTGGWMNNIGVIFALFNETLYRCD